MKHTTSAILALMSAQWKSLMRDRLALLLTFVVPCILFTVLAIIFGGAGTGGGSASKVDVLIRDLDASTVSTRMIESMRGMDGVRLLQPENIVVPEADRNLDDIRLAVAKEVRRGEADAAVIFPAGIEDSVAAFGSQRPSIEIIYDAANPVAQQMLAGFLQGAAFTSAPDVLITRGMEQLQQFGGPLTPQQDSAVAMLKTMLGVSDALDPEAAADTGDAESAGISLENGLVKITTTAARELATSQPAATGLQRQGAMISYYAAGIAVMFLMFSMAGAAASLIELEENGTLERILSGHLTVTGLVVSHWLFYAAMGVMQVGVMFVFASVTFGLDLWHVPTIMACILLSICTSLASAGFTMMLATLCRSRKQLEGTSTIIILIMSAFGGSMVPRFVMPAFVQQTAKLTFNGWALDGYLKVFWYNVPGESVLRSILPEMGVLLMMTAAFMAVAMRFARRWSVR